MLDAKACFRALASRDRRFEGRFVTAVATTRVYCRPGCPAPLPKPQNVVFYAHAAAAEEAGFRPCRRCRPELSPELRTWPDTSRTVTRAVRLIAEGALDGEGSIEHLGTRLGLSGRHLRRLFAKHLGASPIAVALTRRLHLARRLLDETALPITDIAHSAGFSSIRRFNDAFRQTFALSPSEARASGAATRSETPGRARRRGSDVVLRLPFAPPYDWDSMMAFLAKRAIPGVEAVDGNRYRRSIRIGSAAGGFEVERPAGENCLRLRLLAPFPVDLLRITERVRGLFDLDCDPLPIARHLGRDRRLAAIVRRHPGLRLPGAWDPFEMAVRAILGQQVSVRGASTLAGRLAGAFGERVQIDLPGVTHAFPTAARLAGADLRNIGLPSARAEAIRNLARAVSSGSLVLDGSRELDRTVEMLSALPGIGAWTAQYIAMRALGEPDAFPAGDLGVRKALAHDGETPGPAAVARAAEPWRPFRAYAVVHLWRNLQ